MNNKILKSFPAQKDLFVCDITDIVPKGDIGSMEHPIFSLSNKDMRTLEYVHGDNWLKVEPSVTGLATIFDRDVLIFCISQGVAALNAGININRTMRFSAFDLLTATNRTNSGGSAYKSLNNALDRLTGTRVRTNIQNGEIETTESFNLLDGYKILRTTHTGRMIEIEVKLPEWIMGAIQSKHILTYSPDYFTLRRPLDRRLYELMRKHCNNNPKGWSIKLSKLLNKTGSKSTLHEFKRLIIQSEMANLKDEYMPDYNFFVKKGNANPIISVLPKPKMLENLKSKKKQAKFLATGKQLQAVNLKPETIESCRQYVGDVHAMVADWRDWVQTLPNKIKNPDGHFIAFCKKKTGKQ